MNQVGELIQETIEAMECGATDAAFAAACAAVEVTLKKSLETDALTGGDYQKFIKQHWQLLSFMGLPRALPMPLDVDFKLKGIVHGFHINGAEELILHFVRQTAAMGRTPAQFKFHSGHAFEIRANQIYIPATLIGGLVGIVIFQPANKNQTVPDKYWINISDFKMFVSEFWGRIDLAERIMNFYLH
ncbi:MAG TPA: hypothetical protein VK308_17285 [Pyrinomonadaceae bacterium]|nr:hypothetical protein [Pyrinomonadaceae bacterium]